MKIKNKLYFSAGISLILVVILVSVQFVHSQRIAEENKKEELAHSLHKSIIDLNILANEYLLFREKRMESQWNDKYNTVAKILRQAKAEEEEEEEEDKKLVESLRTNYIDLGRLFLQVTRNYNSMIS